MLIQSPAEFGKRALALLVGISRFDDETFRDRPLPFAENDVHDLKSLLCTKLGWNDTQCLVLQGRVRKLDLITAFNSQIATARSAGNISLFLFYISSHGQFFDEEDRPQTGVLLTSDTNLTNLPTAMETGISNQFLSGFLRETRSSQKLIISDACFAGTAVSAHAVTSLSFYNAVDAAILASSRWESFAPANGRNSLFTAALMNVLQQVRGAATFPTLFEPVWQAVRKQASLLGKEQEPLLSHQGGVIVLGYLGPAIGPSRSFTFPEILQSCTALLENQLSREGPDATLSEAHYIARRQTEDSFWDYLSQPGSAPAFTIVGSAGAGKSTTMAHLALQAARRGNIVLWLSGDTEEISDPLSWINRSVERLTPSLTLQDILAALPSNRQLLVFCDAINEWQAGPSRTVDYLKRSVIAARAHSLRLVVSCRENAWPGVCEPFLVGNAFAPREAQSSSANGVSSRLAAFTEDELRSALELYGGIERFASVNIARQPLFVRVISELAKASNVDFDKLSLLEVLDEYLHIRVEKIARRIVTRPTEVGEAIDRIIRELEARHADSLPRADFFSLLPEPLAVSLLDEGLFKYSGEEITVEADIVHEHLLSRVLPNDMFANYDRFLTVIRSSRLAPGAALLRLCSIWNRDLVLKALRWIDQNNNFDVLDALDRLPVLEPYWNFFGPWFAENEDFDWLVADALQRRIDSEIEFCMKAAKAMFVNENYYPWEWKRWRDVTWSEFRERLASMRGAPELLAQCAERKPRYVVSALLSDWLSDPTLLQDSSGVASIDKTAQIYLSALGQRFPEIVLPALTLLMKSHTEWESRVDPILIELSHTMAGETTRYAAGWTNDLPRAVLIVLTELPVEMSAPALELAEQVIRIHPEEANLVESVIAAAARYRTRGALDLINNTKDDQRLINGLIVAITSLHPYFPDECEAIGDELCSRPRLSDTTLGYACSFYRVVSSRRPDLALDFFRLAAALEDPEVARSISSRMIELAKSGNPVFHVFIDERLRIENDPIALFNYAIALDCHRTLRIEDFDWLTRWIELPIFREAGFVLELLAKSNVPLPKAADIVFLLEEQQTSVEAPQPSQRLRELAEQVVDDSRFPSFREGSKGFWRLVAQGRDPRDAHHEVISELLKERLSRQKE
jgi:hypothetical protein